MMFFWVALYMTLAWPWSPYLILDLPLFWLYWRVQEGDSGRLCLLFAFLWGIWMDSLWSMPVGWHIAWYGAVTLFLIYVERNFLTKAFSWSWMLALWGVGFFIMGLGLQWMNWLAYDSMPSVANRVLPDALGLLFFGFRKRLK